MTSEEFIERVLTIGYDVHFNDGVWWIKSQPFFYQPAIPLQVLGPGEARPKMKKALLGYSHHVKNKQYANKYESILLLSEERLREFGMKSLSSSKRAQVKKGLRLTEIRRIEMIEPLLEDMREIEISKAIRIGEVKPPEYYMNHYKEWKEWTIKQFNGDRGKKDYWGSFYNGLLIAYMKVYQIDETAIISYAASHTDHLDKCPNDALTFSILNQIKELETCKRVSYGAWDPNRNSLNEFKQKYGFLRVDLPVYVKYNFHVIPIMKKVLAIKQLRKVNKLIMSYLELLRK
jgi:hypothetical protein